MPELLIVGGKDGAGSPVDALLGLKVLEGMNRLKDDTDKTVA